MTSNALAKIRAARSQLVERHPFYGTLALYLTPVECVQGEGGLLLNTNGVSLFYNPDFIEACTTNELIGAIAHEVYHCALQHNLRIKGRDLKRWNAACDYAINPLLIQAGFVLPEGVLIDPAFQGMSAEEIYTRLSKLEKPKPPHAQKVNETLTNGNEGGVNSPSPQGLGKGPGSAPEKPSFEPGYAGAAGLAATLVAKALQMPVSEPQITPGTAPGGTTVGCNWGAFQPAPLGGVTTSPPEEVWRGRVSHALACAGRLAGTLSADLTAIADQAKKPVVNWREQLQAFIRDKAKTDFSWVTPNKRMLNQGFILPGVIPNGLDKIGICVDTSGSIDEKLFSQFLSEIGSAMDAVNASEVIIVQCDASVKRVDRFSANEPITPKIVGRGGTKFSPALSWFLDNEPDIAVLIYFTDLESNAFGPEPPMPVLWAAYGYESRLNELASKVPFGTVIKITE